MAALTECELVGDTHAPGAARRFAIETVDTLLAGAVPSALVDDLQLIVSELVTNAVRAGTPTVLVSVRLERTRVVVRITDHATGWPAVRAGARVADLGGRGLPLVSSLSASWGVRPSGDGKVVWAELAVPPR